MSGIVPPTTAPRVISSPDRTFASFGVTARIFVLVSGA